MTHQHDYSYHKHHQAVKLFNSMLNMEAYAM